MSFWEEYKSMIVAFATQYGLRVLGALVVIFLAFVLAGVAKRAVDKALQRVKFDATLTRFFSGLARYAVLICAGLGCLGIFGIETTSFAAVIGAAGLAIGLGFQGSLANLAAGVMLLVFRPFSVDQVIQTAGVTGKVIEIGLFFTIIDKPDNKRVIVPNKQIFGAVITNNHHHKNLRVDVAVGTAYEADIDQTRAVLEKAANSIEDGLKDPAPAVVLTGLGASSVDWSVRVWSNKENFWNIHQNLIRAIKNELDAASINIPYPKRDLVLAPESVGEIQKLMKSA